LLLVEVVVDQELTTEAFDAAVVEVLEALEQHQDFL
jgi:hypothetical protein